MPPRGYPILRQIQPIRQNHDEEDDEDDDDEEVEEFTRQEVEQALREE